MKIIELSTVLPNISMLLDAVQLDDVLLVRDGHALARLETFDDDDWEDWKYEHSAEAIALGDAARQLYRDGKFRRLPKIREQCDGEK
jgi:hypothetical protein